ncbi:hypothetical protein E1A91_A07G122800v1 [Gossypium mustelinum]|uniref:Uncharacterized protein n=1 Tax=Gossypium mustelinum TaxID=34275 RepID=A0A5D2YJ66_GOSMU|nr:hypothetical protein E1A91_A07G122800v1 [Gossypium mustelinum]
MDSGVGYVRGRTLRPSLQSSGLSSNNGRWPPLHAPTRRRTRRSEGQKSFLLQSKHSNHKISGGDEGDVLRLVLVARVEG